MHSGRPRFGGGGSLEGAVRVQDWHMSVEHALWRNGDRHADFNITPHDRAAVLYGPEHKSSDNSSPRAPIVLFPCSFTHRDCQMSSQLCRRAYTLPPRAVRGLVLPCARVPDEFHFRGRGKGDERDGRARRGITAGREWAGRSRTARDGRVVRGRGRRKTVHVRSGSSSQGGEPRAASREMEVGGKDVTATGDENETDSGKRQSGGGRKYLMRVLGCKYSDVCERPPADGSLLRQGARREACRQRVLASLSRLADFTCRPEAGTVECLRWATIVQHCCPSKLQRI